MIDIVAVARNPASTECAVGVPGGLPRVFYHQYQLATTSAALLTIPMSSSTLRSEYSLAWLTLLLLSAIRAGT